MFRIVFYMDLGVVDDTTMCTTHTFDNEFRVLCVAKDMEKQDNIVGLRIEQRVRMAPKFGCTEPHNEWVVYEG